MPEARPLAPCAGEAARAIIAASIVPRSRGRGARCGRKGDANQPEGIPDAKNTALRGCGASQAADLDAGKKAFNKCAVCHSPEAGVTRIGPSLFGVIGRKSASLPGYNYSSAMRGL